MIIQQDVKEMLNAAPVEVLNLLSAAWDIGIPVKNGEIEGIFEVNKEQDIKELLAIEIQKVRRLQEQKEEMLRDIQLLLFDDDRPIDKLFLVWDKHRRSA